MRSRTVCTGHEYPGDWHLGMVVVKSFQSSTERCKVVDGVVLRIAEEDHSIVTGMFAVGKNQSLSKLPGNQPITANEDQITGKVAILEGHLTFQSANMCSLQVSVTPINSINSKFSANTYAQGQTFSPDVLTINSKWDDLACASIVQLSQFRERQTREQNFESTVAAVLYKWGIRLLVVSGSVSYGIRQLCAQEYGILVLQVRTY